MPRNKTVMLSLKKGSGQGSAATWEGNANRWKSGGRVEKKRRRDLDEKKPKV